MQYLVCLQAGIKARRVRKRSLARSAQAPRSLHLVLRTTHALYTSCVHTMRRRSDMDGMYESWMIHTCSSDGMTQCRQNMLGYSLGFTHASLWAALQGLCLFFWARQQALLQEYSSVL
jgi:hypothetical protein